MCPGPVPVNGDSECADKPHQASIAVLDTQNREITHFQTDATGYFKINLLPGSYTLHPISENAFPHAPDQTVIVSPGEYTQVDVSYDTGMR
jgi:hypothetical protein